MSDDDRPVNVVIRPVVPSRAGVTERIERDLPPRFDIAAQVEKLGADSLLPPAPQRKKTVKKAKKMPLLRATKPDARRSAAAKAIWAKRRATNRAAKTLSTVTGAHNPLAAAIAALLKLNPAEQDLAVQIARSVVL
jgi:hypothetical protein